MQGKTVRPKKTEQKLTGTDWRLLICAVIVLSAAGLKSMQSERANAVCESVRQALAGGVSTQEVLAVMGQTLDEGGLSQVFSPKQETEQESQEVVTVGGDEVSIEKEGFADDVLERANAQFPDVVDETVYALGIETAQPVVGTRTSGFGMRVNPITGKETFHYGLDIAAPEGTPIQAFASGTVTAIGDNSYGKYLIVEHEGGLSTLYAHCSKIIAAEGDVVDCGETIAEVGATGNATGNHLHIELWRAGKALDPALYMSGV